MTGVLLQKEILFKKQNSENSSWVSLGSIGFSETNKPVFYNTSNQAEEIYHTGNLKIGGKNGLAQLDENGMIAVSDLPSYVSGIVEGTYKNGKFYNTSN